MNILWQSCCILNHGTFQEFMLATDMTSSGSPEEKLRWAFKMYDKDASGEEYEEQLLMSTQ